MAFSPVLILGPAVDGGVRREWWRDAVELGLPVMVVEGGASDVAARLKEEGLGVGVVACGSWAAAFRAAEEGGYTHAVTADADMAWDTSEFAAFMAAAERAPDALIVAVPAEKASADKRPSLRCRITQVLVVLECGFRPSYPAGGVRIYPLGLVRALGRRMGRNGLASEIIARVVWAGGRVVEIPLRGWRGHVGSRGTFGQRCCDLLHIGTTHLRLLGRALLPWPHARWLSQAAPKATGGPSLWRRMLGWLSPLEAWRQLKRDGSAPATLAVGLAAGVFIANLPAFGVQTLLALYVARRLHLHPLAVVAGSLISTPPVGVAMVAAAFCTGHFVLHGTWVPVGPGTLAGVDKWHVVPGLLADWAVGAVVVGVVMSVSVFMLAWWAFGRIPRGGRGEDQSA